MQGFDEGTAGNIAFNPEENRPYQVNAMPNPHNRFVPNVNVNAAPKLVKNDNFDDFGDDNEQEKEYGTGYNDYTGIKETSHKSPKLFFKF